MELREQMSAAAGSLMEQEHAYAVAESRSRDIIRKTKQAIHGIHMGNRDAELIDSISADLASLTEAVADFPRVLWGPAIESAMTEFAETVLYDQALRGETLMPHTDLDVTPSAWVCGLADAVGEMRRDLLTVISKNDIAEAKRIFSAMEEMSDALMELDIRDTVAPVRRKQDICRGIMDRSRGDLTNAVMFLSKRMDIRRKSVKTS